MTGHAEVIQITYDPNGILHDRCRPDVTDNTTSELYSILRPAVQADYARGDFERFLGGWD